MKFSKLFAIALFSFLFIATTHSQILVAPPQTPNGAEGGELKLSGTSIATRSWHIDQYNNEFRIHSNGLVPMYIDQLNHVHFSKGITTKSFYVSSSSNVEGGEITLLGGGNHNHWAIDNHAGNMRMFHGGAVFFNLNPQGVLTLNSNHPVEGGELVLAGAAGNMIIDNFNGGLRIFKQGGGMFNMASNGNAFLSGKFECRAIKVTTTPTADFVFADNYQVRSLEATEAFIKKYRHLPEIASAKDMEKDGLDVANFQIQLLQKIEELTLYTIEQEKQIKALTEDNKIYKELLKRIETLEAKQ